MRQFMVSPVRDLALISLLIISWSAVASPSGLNGTEVVGGANGARTFALVLTSELPGHWESPDASVECPHGLAHTELENWQALHPGERAYREANFGHRWNRGPNGENSTAVPWAINDPLPHRDIQGRFGIGFNLDGTDDGHATATTCEHKKFIEPETGAPISNQLYRVMGCVQGWRAGGAAAGYRLMEFPTYPQNRILIEISNVENLENDDDVHVRFFKGSDPILRTSRGAILRNMPHRVDDRFPPIAESRGSIVGGVLTIEPVDYARFPMRWNVRTGTRDWYDFQVRLTFTEEGATGLFGGYQDLENYWLMYRRGLSVSVDNSAWSPPSMYEATLRAADGRRDVDTGQCTAISSSLIVNAVWARIVYPTADFDAATFDLRGY